MREIVCRARRAAQFVVTGLVERRQFLPQCRRERLMRMCEQARCAAGEIDEDSVDPVEAGAGHQPDVGLGHATSVEARQVGRAQQIQPFDVYPGGLLELGFQFRCDRQRGGHRHLQRILMHVVEAEFVMQVGAGREPGRADETDHLALRDAPAFAQPLGDAGQMAVPSRVLGLVAQHHDVAVTALAPGDSTTPSAVALTRVPVGAP